MAILTYCEPWEETLGKPHGSCYKALSSLHEKLSSATEGRISLDTVLAWCLVVGWLYVASLGEVCAVTTQLGAPLSVWLLDYYYLRHRRYVSPFYPSLAVAALIVLFGIFELEVVPFMEILPHENILFLCLVCAFVWMVRCVRRGVTSGDLNGSYCKSCEVVAGKDHHSMWLGVCVGDSSTRRRYVCLLLSLLAACLYGASLTLTTICRPRLYLNFFLLPDSCPEVFEDVSLSTCFVSAVCALEISVVCLLSLSTLIYRSLCRAVPALRHNH